MQRYSTVCLLLSLTSLATLAGAVEPVTTETLLTEMIDTVRLGQFPAPSYSTVQYSSYDRRSTIPGGPGWFANSDGFGGEPVPNFEAVLEEPDETGVGRYLICDVRGPGAIVRTWTAAIEGTLRVVLDDAQEPLFEGPAAEFLQNRCQSQTEAAGVPEDLYLRAFRQRDACYLPIAFSQRCRIEWLGNPRRIHFYEVQIRRYARGTDVVGFTNASLPAVSSTLQHVAHVLGDPQNNWDYRSQLEPLPIHVELPAGETATALAMDGTQAIERLTLKIAAGNLDRALRQTILHVNFDQHASDQVQCPLGDFFGAGPGINPFNSVPFTVAPDGTMTCRFVMPFARSCQIRLENLGQQPVTVSGSALPMPWTWDEPRSMHLRARWRVNHELTARPGAGARDIPFVLANGTGVYVGTAIMLLNPSPIPTPYGSWWGEGDEKIFVDDDVRPSTFGTGSEDYFNYSWSVPDIFLYPYCGQARNDGPANRGFVVNQRWHIMDAIPFEHRLAFFMELYSHKETRHFSYARIGYHYGRPGLMDDFVALTREDVRPLELPANWQPEADFGARNSVFFQAEDVLATKEHTSPVEGNLWSGGRLLTWSPAAESEQLAFKLPVTKGGKYAIHVTAAETPQAGRLVALLDGQPLRFATDNGELELRTDFRVQLRDFISPDVELAEGTHVLALQLAPDHARTDGPPTIGIDFLWLQQR